MIIELGNDVSHGIEAVHADLSHGRTGLWLGNGPAGFALLVGAHKVQPLGSGAMIGVSLTAASLVALRARIDSLLDPLAPKRVELDGLKIGDKPKGD